MSAGELEQKVDLNLVTEKLHPPPLWSLSGVSTMRVRWSVMTTSCHSHTWLDVETLESLVPRVHLEPINKDLYIQYVFPQRNLRSQEQNNMKPDLKMCFNVTQYSRTIETQRFSPSSYKSDIPNYLQVSRILAAKGHGLHSGPGEQAGDDHKKGSRDLIWKALTVWCSTSYIYCIFIEKTRTT